jgi:hypothetical protein
VSYVPTQYSRDLDTISQQPHGNGLIKIGHKCNRKETVNSPVQKVKKVGKNCTVLGAQSAIKKTAHVLDFRLPPRTSVRSAHFLGFYVA